MMYKELYQFLILHKQLPVPGIGTFLLERNPATGDFPNKKIIPPVYSVALKPAVNTPSKKFFYWLSAALNVSDREAIIHFNDFAFEIKKKINAGDVINWNGIGTLSKGFAGEVKFTPVYKPLDFDRPVTAEKMIRQRAEHFVRVGEDERTSTQMSELLSQPTEKRNYWWAYAIVVSLIATMFLGWYFSEHGLNVPSTGNQKKFVPAMPAPTKKSLN